MLNFLPLIMSAAQQGSKKNQEGNAPANSKTSNLSGGGSTQTQAPAQPRTEGKEDYSHEKLNAKMMADSQALQGQMQEGFDLGRGLEMTGRLMKQGPERSGFLANIIGSAGQSPVAPIGTNVAQSLGEPERVPTPDFSSGVDLSGGPGVLPPIGAMPQQPQQNANIAPLPTQNPGSVGLNDLTSAAPQIGGQAPQAFTQGQDGQTQVGGGEGFNPFGGLFKGTLDNPNGLLRLSEGYNQGGLVGALGMLGTDMRAQSNPVSIPGRIDERNRQKGL